MSRLLSGPPDTGIKVEKLSENKHRIWNVIAEIVEDVDKNSLKGWGLSDGTYFDQEQDAIAQACKDKGITYNRKKSKIKPNYFTFKAGQLYKKIRSFHVDLKLVLYKDFKCFQVIETQNSLVLQGAKSVKDADAGKWFNIGLDQNI